MPKLSMIFSHYLKPLTEGLKLLVDHWLRNPTDPIPEERHSKGHPTLRLFPRVRLGEIIPSLMTHAGWGHKWPEAEELNEISW